MSWNPRKERASEARRVAAAQLIGVAALSFSALYFLSDVIEALQGGFSALGDDLGALMTAHGAIMVFAGVGFGVALIRAHVLPAWTGVALGVGVTLVAATQSAPEGVQLIAAAIRDLAFAGMGLALLSAPSRARQSRTKAFFASDQHRAIGPDLK
jgi:hypothetical protein